MSMILLPTAPQTIEICENLNKDFLTRIKKTILSAIFLLIIVEALKCYKIYQRFIEEAHTKHYIHKSPICQKRKSHPCLKS